MVTGSIPSPLAKFLKVLSPLVYVVLGWCAKGMYQTPQEKEVAVLNHPVAVPAAPPKPIQDAAPRLTKPPPAGKIYIDGASKFAKRVVQNAFETNKLTDRVCEFLSITPGEKEKIETRVAATVVKLKELEKQNCTRERDEQGGEFLKVASYWEKSGRDQFNALQQEIGGILGEDRGNWLITGIGQSSLVVGDFGYWEKHLFVSDTVVSDDGTKATTLSIRPVDPASEWAKKLMTPADSDATQIQRELEFKRVSQERNDAPFMCVGITIRASQVNDPIRARYTHLFPTPE